MSSSTGAARAPPPVDARDSPDRLDAQSTNLGCVRDTLGREMDESPPPPPPPPMREEARDRPEAISCGMIGGSALWMRDEEEGGSSGLSSCSARTHPSSLPRAPAIWATHASMSARTRLLLLIVRVGCGRVRYLCGPLFYTRCAL